MTYELWIPQKQASNMQQQHKAAQLQKKKTIRKPKQN